MNYKLNVLKNKVECKERVFPEIPVYTGTLENGEVVFDIDRYCYEAGIENENWVVFTQRHKHYVEQFAKIYEKNTSEMFYQNTDGHILIDFVFVFLYLMYINEELSAYFFTILSDVLSTGMGFSDTYIMELAAERLPDDMVARMINGKDEYDDGESSEKSDE